MGELPKGTGIPFDYDRITGRLSVRVSRFDRMGAGVYPGIVNDGRVIIGGRPRRGQFRERRCGGDLVATSHAEGNTEQLESLGYRVLACPSGEAALTTAQAYRGAIDLRVTDVVMPA